MNNKYKVLVVDSDKESLALVASLLAENQYKAICADNCSSAKIMYDSYLPDLIILELDLNDADGTQLLEHVRENALTPVIVLSVRSEEKDKVAALDMGANDYITKPYGKNELLARVRAALRNYRHGMYETYLSGGKFVYEGLAIDYDARRIFVEQKEIKLTQTEYNIISFLSLHCGKMMTYEAIIKAIWGGSADGGSIKKLQVNMANIRKKLCDSNNSTYINNEPGVGYRMG